MAHDRFPNLLAMGRKLVADRRANEVGSVGVEAFLDQEVDLAQVDAWSERLAARVDLEDLLAALAVVVTAVLIAAGGRSEGVTPQGEPSWQGLAGALRPRVAVGQRVIVLLKAPAFGLQFVEPRFDLDMVVTQPSVKERLRLAS